MSPSFLRCKYQNARARVFRSPATGTNGTFGKAITLESFNISQLITQYQYIIRYFDGRITDCLSYSLLALLQRLQAALDFFLLFPGFSEHSLDGVELLAGHQIHLREPF